MNTDIAQAVAVGDPKDSSGQASSGQESSGQESSGQDFSGQDFSETESPGSEHGRNIHDALLEGVSPGALATASDSDGEPAPVVTASAPATTEPAPAATEPPDRVANLTVVPEETAAPAAGVRETVETATDAVETVVRTLPATMAEPLPAAMSAREGSPASFGTSAERALSPRISEGRISGVRISGVMGELGEVNTTVLSYLRGEGAAALAHWQALSGAKNPADAIRLQVSEMQRAADASLSCFAALARRASRFTGTIGRR
ncbi:hypothetical protein ASF58_19470 [Methylobacterium sp. Leaf125]|uniref:hypothetical protein n=1 Tax=Methylobacterium sp. Leaf125 TaxID=1736265 RepID=UPI0006FD9185|nr:hypothetical protein [Methylobacterium sp. Leaf125]KQQ45216.1 hypothetical protein ASF58_19470 [Methylobacterium sp. Leaf125]